MTPILRIAVIAALTLAVGTGIVGLRPASYVGGPDPSTSPGSPAASSAVQGAAALVTGEYTRTGVDFVEQTDVAYGMAERGRVWHGTTEMSDPRLSGDVSATDDADRFCDGACTESTFVGDVLWGTIEISNDGGTWAGTSVGTSDVSAGGAGVTYYELSGTGAYEGLAAVLFEGEIARDLQTVEWNGVIFPGELPPER